MYQNYRSDYYLAKIGMLCYLQLALGASSGPKLLKPSESAYSSLEYSVKYSKPAQTAQSFIGLRDVFQSNGTGVGGNVS